MDLTHYNANIFELFLNQWALLTAGNKEDFNSMTIAWGTMGTLWNKSVITVYVNPLRYTYDFMNKNDLFTVDFFPAKYHKELGLMGSRSGRDGDRLKGTSLTPCFLDNAVHYKEAELSFICKKLYTQDLVKSSIPQELAKQFYAPEHQAHRMYVGEVIDVIQNKEYAYASCGCCG